jgi:hypothetical protein
MDMAASMPTGALPRSASNPMRGSFSPVQLKATPIRVSSKITVS